MSFVIIAASPTSCAPVRTLSLRALLAACGVAAVGLLAAGTGLGYWLSQPLSQAIAGPQPARPMLPFAVEQLGALSGRLFRLESQAGQLSERIGAMQGVAIKPPPAVPAVRTGKADRGGPMLPPRPGRDELGALEDWLAVIEQQIARVADAATLQNQTLMRLPTRLPVNGSEVVSMFGNRDDPFTGRRAFHSGLDFAALPGTPIHAAAGGTVSYAAFRPDFGWCVEIEHGNGLLTRYGHASRLLVKAGDVVTPRAVVAEVGSSGRATGPHLHFEVLRNGEAIDPRRYLAGL